MKFDSGVRVGRNGWAEKSPSVRALRNVDVDVLARVIVHRAVETQPNHREIARRPNVLDDRAIPPGGSLVGVGGAAHHPGDQVERLIGGGVDGLGPGLAELAAQRRIQGATQRVVLAWQHTVLAVIPAELGKKGHWLLRALLHQLAVHPVQCVGESGSLAIHFGRKQVAYRGVEGEPVSVEAVDQLIAGNF